MKKRLKLSVYKFARDNGSNAEQGSFRHHQFLGSFWTVCCKDFGHIRLAMTMDVAPQKWRRYDHFSNREKMLRVLYFLLNF